MKQYTTDSIRDFALLGHSGSGKTSVGEALLFVGKTTTRLGRVDDDTSNLDSEPEEIKRKSTVSSSFGYVEWGKKKLNFVDTPGDMSFSVDMRMSLIAADSAVLVVSAPDGVQVGTEMGWSCTDEASLPTAIFINKMDRERADFDRVMGQISKLTEKAAPVQIPIGKEGSFEGVIDLLKNKAIRFLGDGLESKAEDIPDNLKGEVEAAREKLVEALASTDDSLIEKYLETGEISEEEARGALAKGFASRSFVPVLCGSAAKCVGLQPLMDFASDLFPAPNTKPPVKGKDAKDNDVERNPDSSEPMSAYCFKTISADIGRVNVFRVISGTLTADSTVLNASKDANERAGQIYVLLGKKRQTTTEAVAGDIIGLAKLKETRTGHTLCDEKSPVTYDLLERPKSVISFAIKPKSQGDEDKVAAKLAEITQEDISLQVIRDQQSKELLLSGMGQTHIEVTVEKLKRLGVDVELLPPKVPYKETIRGTVKGVEGKHKKQSGGRGQFGVCYIDIEPMPRGGGFEFENAIFGGSIPKQYIPAVEKGVRSRMAMGVVAGYEVVDVKVRLTDGKYHAVDSDGRSFEMAGRRGFSNAVQNARPVLLEPVMDMEIVCPADAAGDIMGHINSKRGRVLGMEAVGQNQAVKAKMPMAEVLRYEADLRSMTQGRGSFTMEFSHYDEVPDHLADKIIASAKVTEDEE